VIATAVRAADLSATVRNADALPILALLLAGAFVAAAAAATGGGDVPWLADAIRIAAIGAASALAVVTDLAGAATGDALVAIAAAGAPFAGAIAATGGATRTGGRLTGTAAIALTDLARIAAGGTGRILEAFPRFALTRLADLTRRIAGTRAAVDRLLQVAGVLHRATLAGTGCGMRLGLAALVRMLLLAGLLLPFSGTVAGALLVLVRFLVAPAPAVGKGLILAQERGQAANEGKSVPSSRTMPRRVSATASAITSRSKRLLSIEISPDGSLASRGSLPSNQLQRVHVYDGGDGVVTAGGAFITDLPESFV
jgi:hypothetical protein